MERLREDPVTHRSTFDLNVTFLLARRASVLRRRSSLARSSCNCTHARVSLIRRRLTQPESDPFDTVEWDARSVELRGEDGTMAFACEGIEAPGSWSDTAVAIVARRYLGRVPDGAPERSVRQLVERVVQTIGGWALASGHAPGAEDRTALECELAALVLSQRATFATPVWLNVGLEQRPFTSACFILETEDSIARCWTGTRARA